MFNPDFDVPETDEQAEIAIRHGKDDLIGRNLIGIYRCRRGLGDSLLKAYETALRAHIEACDAAEAAQ